MKPNQLTTALVAIVNARLGIREAATLSALSGGASIWQIAVTLGDTPVGVRGRIGTLKRKKLAAPRFTEDGVAVYHPTMKGEKVLTSAGI